MGPRIQFLHAVTILAKEFKLFKKKVDDSSVM